MCGKKGGGSVATVHMCIVDASGQGGNVVLRTWVQNPKTKECTVQVDKVKSQEARFVKLFAETFVRYALEEAMKGNNIKNIFKNPSESMANKATPPCYKCELCDKIFKEV